MSTPNPGDLTIGVGDPTTPDAGVPDGGAPDSGGEASDVNGVAIDQRVTSPTTVVPVPRDLSAWVLQAYVPDDVPGGFRILDADNQGSSFTIPAVPAGSFYLLAVIPGDPVPHFFQTASRSLDLGFLRVGRVDGPVPALPTNVTLQIAGASPVQNGDRFFIDSFATGGETLAFAPSGATSLDTVFDWRDTGAVLLNAAEGDDLFVTQQRRTPNLSGQFQRTIVDAFTTRAVTLVDGQPTSVVGAFDAPLVTSNQQVQFNPASYIQGHDVPLHQQITMLMRMRAGLTGAISQGSPVLDLTQTVNASQQAAFGFATINDPYPLDWPRFVVAVPTTFWNYAARGTTQATQYFGLTFHRAPASSFFQFGAPFPAPHGIRLGGVDSSQAGAVPFDGAHPVTIEWQPIVGVTHYTVSAMQITSDGSAAALTLIATFDVTATSAQMPASLFQVGGSYVFSVASVVDPTTDFAGGVLIRQGFPIAIHDAVTARLLFAGSCGNGVVDAVFEQCDSGGVASATCNPDCTIPVCGDGFANTLAHESCDDAGDSMFCNANCTLAACGDGQVHFAGGEVCDDGNTASGDGCSTDCFIEPGFSCSGEPSVCSF